MIKLRRGAEMDSGPSDFSSDSSTMQMNLPRRVTSEIRVPGKQSPNADGSSTKSDLPRRTSRIVRPGNDARNPRTTVSTSGSSGIVAARKIAHPGRTIIQSRVLRTELRQRKAGSRDNACHAQDLLVFLFGDERNNQADIF